MDRPEEADRRAAWEAQDAEFIRRRLWQKGETSGHFQRVREIRLDCDNDAILLIVEQTGGIACHTGRHRCFFQRLDNGAWHTVEPVIKDPKAIYGQT